MDHTFDVIHNIFARTKSILDVLKVVTENSLKNVLFIHKNILQQKVTKENPKTPHDRRYNVGIVVVVIVHVLPHFHSQAGIQPIIQKGPPAPALRLASFTMIDKSQSCSLRE